MAKRIELLPQERSTVLFDAVFEDGSRASNRRVPMEILGGLDGGEPNRQLIEQQKAEITEGRSSATCDQRSDTICQTGVEGCAGVAHFLAGGTLILVGQHVQVNGDGLGQGTPMESEPRPVEIRHAVVGAILMALGAYVGGGAVWSWLFWADQQIDASRLFALLFAFVSIMGGWTLIERWLAGEWFAGRKHRWNTDNTNMQDHSGSHSGDTSGSGSSCNLGTNDGGSCSN